MFLMFQLERPDVVALGGLGIRRVVERTHGLDARSTAAERTALGEPWRAHRTIAGRNLWRSLDNARAVAT
jgi:DNA-3-methyladenine glycosylase II